MRVDNDCVLMFIGHASPSLLRVRLALHGLDVHEGFRSRTTSTLLLWKAGLLVGLVLVLRLANADLPPIEGFHSPQLQV